MKNLSPAAITSKKNVSSTTPSDRVIGNIPEVRAAGIVGNSVISPGEVLAELPNVTAGGVTSKPPIVITGVAPGVNASP